ncbi:tetratricopeptide repeat protein [Methylobacter tundripaludum]|uniref:Tetratricopeptide repeat protein n=1 Tax=Methylobacter tundripaludum TaxID=173365 RepID=A0A2S6H8Z2_9GAMM|nr:tetratricopeptide repeat protein [Methylobacter tundripaludum]PPK73938.1 tetratricopeptide repeat protein [Methylobacter tundripaludum]
MPVNNLVTDFQRLLNEAQTAGTENELFLQVMEPGAAKQFRLCAVPHQFDSKILRILDPNLTTDQAQLRCEEFSRLSAVTQSGERWAVHDKWRRGIFAKWLQPDNYPEFQIASQRLADFFYNEFDVQSGEEKESALRSHMYHLLGADQEAGFGQFEVLFQYARRYLRLAECATLIKLVHDYDAVLTTDNAVRLSYHEGKLASDQCDWKKAEQLFTDLLHRPDIEPELLAKTYRRLGYVFASQGHYDAAIEYQRSAQKIAETTPEASQIIPSILHEMGVAFRDNGDFTEAEKILQESLERAVMQEKQAWVPIVYNSLGHLYLMQHQALQAITSFTSALEKLKEPQDIIQMSQVYNNLGLAYLEWGDWQTSQDWFTKSLEIKRKSGDVLGQASALNNLSIVSFNLGHKDEAIANTSEAAVLLKMAGELKKEGVCKQNLAKYYRKLGKKDLARQNLAEAIDLFVSVRNTFGELESRTELENIDKNHGLPWWAWLAICLIFLPLIVGLIFLT